MPNVVFVTTMWDRVAMEAGEQREEELKRKFWAKLIAKGSEVKRFYATTESALDILHTPLNKPSVTILPRPVNDPSRHRKNASKRNIIGRIKGMPQGMLHLGRKLSELSKFQNATLSSAPQPEGMSIQLSADDSLIMRAPVVSFS
ncbi:hypothetical protein FRC19_009068 [Serendipita sp. 401]|nr:hypothetical protein FRC15_002884 [Serendipita sp. 397]KAG8820208.1 hypothetical protein FRC19_009068 [Serendipita sp. 401]KAG8832683.1 hypothetical protein FRC18_004731 [Serendipita sp. 400]